MAQPAIYKLTCASNPQDGGNIGLCHDNVNTPSGYLNVTDTLAAINTTLSSVFGATNGINNVTASGAIDHDTGLTLTCLEFMGPFPGFAFLAAIPQNEIDTLVLSSAANSGGITLTIPSGPNAGTTAEITAPFSTAGITAALTGLGMSSQYTVEADAEHWVIDYPAVNGGPLTVDYSTYSLGYTVSAAAIADTEITPGVNATQASGTLLFSAGSGGPPSGGTYNADGQTVAYDAAPVADVNFSGACSGSAASGSVAWQLAVYGSSGFDIAGFSSGADLTMSDGMGGSTAWDGTMSSGSFTPGVNNAQEVRNYVFPTYTEGTYTILGYTATIADTPATIQAAVDPTQATYVFSGSCGSGGTLTVTWVCRARNDLTITNNLTLTTPITASITETQAGSTAGVGVTQSQIQAGIAPGVVGYIFGG